MLRFNNLSIGTKLAITSALSALFVAAMIATLLLGNSAVRSSTEGANGQQRGSFTALNLKATIRGMQVGVRDARLAGSAEDIKKADDYLAARKKSANA